jgi:hypothetical protein
MRPKSNSLILLAALFASILAFTRVLAAQSRGPQHSQEQVNVAGHLDLQGKPVKQILQQQRGEKGYLFLRRADKNAFAIVDVTNAAKPILLDRNALPEPTGGNINLPPSGSALAIAFVPDRRSGVQSEGDYHVVLPQTNDFLKANLRRDPTADLAKAEGEKK